MLDCEVQTTREKGADYVGRPAGQPSLCGPERVEATYQGFKVTAEQQGGEAPGLCTSPWYSPSSSQERWAG